MDSKYCLFPGDEYQTNLSWDKDKYIKKANYFWIFNAFDLFYHVLE